MRQILIVTLVTGLVVGGSAVPLASAKSRPPSDDPEPTSPSGAVYAIPLQNGRADAAPHNGGSSSTGGEGGGSGSSASSAGVSSAGAAGGVAGSAENAGAGSHHASADHSTIHSEHGFGSSSEIPGTRANRAEGRGKGVVPVPVSTERSGGPTTGTWLLIALIAAFGVYFGVTASRAMRDR